jgi:hypothetical protein
LTVTAPLDDCVPVELLVPVLVGDEEGLDDGLGEGLVPVFAVLPVEVLPFEFEVDPLELDELPPLGDGEGLGEGDGLGEGEGLGLGDGETGAFVV